MGTPLRAPLQFNREVTSVDLDSLRFGDVLDEANSECLAVMRGFTRPDLRSTRNLGFPYVDHVAVAEGLKPRTKASLPPGAHWVYGSC